MKQLLIRADDLGYSYAVDLGIARALEGGLVRSVGLMPNMPEAARGWSWIAERDIAVGQHTNVCLGTPCASPDRIPSLVDGHGQFKSSRVYRACAKEGVDFVDFDEALIEIEAQYQRFLEIVGREPDYFEAHAVASPTLFAAISCVAARHGLREQPLTTDPTQAVCCGASMVRMVMRSSSKDYDPAESIREVVQTMRDGETIVVVCHPGFLDQFILQNSSLTVNRTKEVDALTSPELAAWLGAQPDLSLIDYRAL